MENQKKIEFIFVALFAAIISAGAFISIPLSGGIPIIIQNMFVLLSGLLLGPLLGVLSVFLWLLAGSIGLPVFANGTSGFVKFLGFTGGFLYGYLLTAFISGIIYKIKKNNLFLALSCFIGISVNYIPGIFHIIVLFDKTIQESLNVAFYPFILIDLSKALVAFFIVKNLQKTMNLFFRY